MGELGLYLALTGQCYEWPRFYVCSGIGTHFIENEKIELIMKKINKKKYNNEFIDKLLHENSKSFLAKVSRYSLKT